MFVYVDETRPRSQGGRLTAWELKNEGIPHVIIPDNAAATLMAQKKIDMVIVGADRIALNGDTANKIGTLEKAILAKEFGIPFYVAAPVATFDVECRTGKKIPIEERSSDEVMFQTGRDANGNIVKVMVINQHLLVRWVLYKIELHLLLKVQLLLFKQYMFLRMI